MSSEIRYSVLRMMLSPLMIFEGKYKIQAKFIDLGDCVIIDDEKFFLEISLEFQRNKVSSAYLNIESVMKSNKYFVKKLDNFSQNPSFSNKKNIYTIIDEEENSKDSSNLKSKILEENERKKIDALIDELENSDEEQEEILEDKSGDDEDYFEKLEK